MKILRSDIKEDNFLEYFMSNVETKDFDVLTDGKIFFDVPIKNNEETYKKIIEMRKIVITPLVT